MGIKEKEASRTATSYAKTSSKTSPIGSMVKQTGRPVKGEEKLKRYNYSIAPSLKEKIDEAAARQGRSASSVVSEALRDYLAKQT